MGVGLAWAVWKGVPGPSGLTARGGTGGALRACYPHAAPTAAGPDQHLQLAATLTAAVHLRCETRLCP